MPTLLSESQIVVLSRVITAFFGTLIVFLTYKLSRQSLSEQYALGAALLTAVSPGIVIHSHYLKEDIIFTFGILLSFLCFFNFADQIIGTASAPSQQPIQIDSNESDGNEKIPWIQTALLGMSIGLVFASKYKSAIVVLIYLITPVCVPRLRRRAYYKGLFFSLIIALIVFLLINFPIFTQLKDFKNGFTYEMNHSVIGHHGILGTVLYLL